VTRVHVDVVIGWAIVACLFVTLVLFVLGVVAGAVQLVQWLTG
jgi:hypothetical protein